MPSSKNLVHHLQSRERNQRTNCHFQRHFYSYQDLVYRLSLSAELQGHAGCVNCLQWNEKGTILASGSDDYKVILWDPFGRRKLQTIETGHINNIFSVQFAPGSDDRVVITGAGDSKVRVHDVNNANAGECLQVYSCHFARVKRLAVARPEANLVWSAGEDGLVMQFDLREPATCKNVCKHVLINLNAHMGPEAEIKCLAVNPCRPELMAVGANDPYVRIYDRRMLSLKSVKVQPSDRFLWDRSTALTLSLEKENYDFPPSAVQYYIAGHLPVKCQDFRRRHRPLASTYLTFSPCGSNLLVNLGGEQIYLFDINTKRRSLLSDFRKYFDSPCFASENAGSTNGYLNGASTSNGYSVSSANGFSSNGTVHLNGFTKWLDCLSSVNENYSTEHRKRSSLSPRAEVLKQQANKYFENKNYNLAVQMYSEAVFVAPKAAVLYANRAAAYMKRDWDGDVYAALQDCFVTLQLDPEHLKAHFRLAKCLFDLKQYKSAQKCLEMFKSKFPDQSKTPNCLALDKEIIGAIFENQSEARASKRKRNRSGSSISESSSSDGLFEPKVVEDAGANSAAFSVGGPSQPNGVSKPLHVTGLSEQEVAFRESACDYDLRFCGHCNTTTDIKEANFFGSNGEYIIGGSDDGKFFIWDRRTCNIVRALIGDESIVNCLQPHPTQCLLASSGIDSTVKLWSPRPEDGSADMRDVPDQGNVATANQRRMNADPLEVMLINMGYRISGLIDAAGGGVETERPPAGAVQCSQS